MRFTLFAIFLCLFIIINAKRIERRAATVIREEPKYRNKPASYRSSLFPKTKQVSDYERCKSECRKLRDRVELEEYVRQLRDEISDLETRVHEDDKIREKEQPNLEEEGTFTRMAKSAKRVVSNAVHTVTGADEDEQPRRTVVIHH